MKLSFSETFIGINKFKVINNRGRAGFITLVIPGPQWHPDPPHASAPHAGMDRQSDQQLVEEEDVGEESIVSAQHAEGEQQLAEEDGVLYGICWKPFLSVLSVVPMDLCVFFAIIWQYGRI